MSARDFIARARSRLSAAPAPKTKHPDVDAALARIAEETNYVTLGHIAKEFMATPFYAVLEERLNAKADALHEDLLSGAVGPDAYARAYKTIKDVLLLAPSAVERGQKAGEQLKEWREDGTLEEAELWRSHPKE